MKNLDAACIEAYATSPSNVATLDTIQLSHPDLAEDIYLVNDRASHTLTLEDDEEVLFRGVAFKLTKPKTDEGGVQALSLVIDDIGEEISDFINTVKGSKVKIQLKYRVFLSNDFTKPQNNPPLVMTLSGIKKNKYQVSASANFADLINKQHISELYTRARFPSLGG